MPHHKTITNQQHLTATSRNTQENSMSSKKTARGQGRVKEQPIFFSPSSSHPLFFFSSPFFISFLPALSERLEQAHETMLSDKRCGKITRLPGMHRRSQYEANRGTRLGKILPNTVDFYFFYQTDNIRRFHTADFVQRTVCSPRL